MRTGIVLVAAHDVFWGVVPVARRPTPPPPSSPSLPSLPRLQTTCPRDHRAEGRNGLFLFPLRNSYTPPAPPPPTGRAPGSGPRLPSATGAGPAKPADREIPPAPTTAPRHRKRRRHHSPHKEASAGTDAAAGEPVAGTGPTSAASRAPTPPRPSPWRTLPLIDTSHCSDSDNSEGSEAEGGGGAGASGFSEKRAIEETLFAPIPFLTVATARPSAPISPSPPAPALPANAEESTPAQVREPKGTPAGKRRERSAGRSGDAKEAAR